MRRRSFLQTTGVASAALALGVPLPARAASEAQTPKYGNLKSWQVAQAMHKQRPVRVDRWTDRAQLQGNAMKAEELPSLLADLRSHAFRQSVSRWYLYHCPVVGLESLTPIADVRGFRYTQRHTKGVCNAELIRPADQTAVPYELYERRPGLLLDMLATMFGYASVALLERLRAEPAPLGYGERLGVIAPPLLTVTRGAGHVIVRRGPLFAGWTRIYPICSHGLRVEYFGQAGNLLG